MPWKAMVRVGSVTLRPFTGGLGDGRLGAPGQKRAGAVKVGRSIDT